MTDIASLFLKIDSSQAKAASSDLGLLTAVGKKAEDQFAKIQRAAALGGTANKEYASALSQAYRFQGKLNDSQIVAIRTYETLIGKTNLLMQGRGREAAQFEALRKAGATADTKYGQTVAMLSGTLYDLEQQTTKTDRASSNFANTLTRRLIFGYLISQLRQMVGSIAAVNRELAKTGDVGRFTGLGSQNVQGFQAAAAQRGIDSGKFLDDMTAFARQVYNAKTGVGELAALFRANGAAVDDIQSSFLKVADLVKNTKDDVAKFSILQQAGLPATAEWVRFMEQGSEAIRSASANADKLTDDQIKAARRLDDSFNKLWDDFTRAGKRAVVEVVDFMRDLDAAARRAVLPFAFDRSAALANLMREHGTQFDGARATEFYDSIFGKNRGPGSPTSITVGPGSTVDTKRLQQQLSLEAQRLSILGQFATIGQQVRAIEIQIAQARLNDVRVTKEEEDTLKRLAAERALGITNIRSQTDAMNVEIATFGMSVGAATAFSLVQTQINEQRRLGKQLAPQEIADLERYAEAAGAAAQRLDNMREAAGLTSSFVKDFKNDLMQGKSAWESFGHAAQNVLNKISDKLIDMAINNLFAKAFGGAGGGGGFLSSIFSALFSGGPAFSAHGLYHEGGIAGQPKQTRYVHPAYFDDAPRYHSGGIAGLAPDEVPAILRRGEPVFKSMQDARDKVGGTSITVGGSTIIIQGNADEKTLAAMKAELDRRDRELPVKIIGTVREARSRRAL